MKRNIPSVLILVWLSVLTFLVLRQETRDHGMMDLAVYQDNTPFKNEIKKIIEPLRYNGLYRLMEPNVYIALDFDKMRWTLKNVHRFDAAGNILLAHGRYGVCGDLAVYTYSKIKPLLGKRYEVDFLLTAESSFFKAGTATHTILRITDKFPSIIHRYYLLDPAFKKYGHPEALFKNYLPLEVMERLDFLKNKDPDESFSVDGGPPIFINRNTLFSLYIISSRGNFDADNYGIALAVCKRYAYMNEYVYAVMKTGGQVQVFENKENLDTLLPPGKYDQLKKLVDDLFLRTKAASKP